MFYLRLYNFGINDCSKDTAVMCMWDETIAGSLMQYISKLPPTLLRQLFLSE